MRYLWLALFALLIAILAAGPLFFSSGEQAEEQLLVISPHWDGIRHEFGRAFAAQYLKTTGKSINVAWVDVGGMGEIVKYLELRFGSAGPQEGVNLDVLFGGGMDKMPALAASGFFEPFPLPLELAKKIPAELNGQPLRDPLNRYLAACLSCFGFVYNKLVLEKAHLPTPKTWEDLGAPAFQGWVSCGDPTLSGSLHMAFELVLQGEGWEKGYTTLVRLISNVRSFNEGGSSVPRDVSLGQAAVGPCIDFYASAPIRRQGAAHLQLVIPAQTAVATPDPIAILRHPPNPEAARAFVEFVLSEAGQRLWYEARGEPGGPVDYDLERLPVMPEIYERGYKTYTVLNPFKQAGVMKYDFKKGGGRWNTLNDLWRATILEVHGELNAARQAVLAAGRDGDLGYALGQAPLSEAAVAKLAAAKLPADERNALRNRWSAWAREWYAAIARAARTGGPVPEFRAAPSIAD